MTDYPAPLQTNVTDLAGVARALAHTIVPKDHGHPVNNTGAVRFKLSDIPGYAQATESQIDRDLNGPLQAAFDLNRIEVIMPHVKVVDGIATVKVTVRYRKQA